MKVKKKRDAQMLSVFLFLTSDLLTRCQVVLLQINPTHHPYRLMNTNTFNHTVKTVFLESQLYKCFVPLTCKRRIPTLLPERIKGMWWTDADKETNEGKLCH